MLPKSKRLTRKEFDNYFKVGRRVHSPNLQLIYTNQPSFNGAVVVGKKVYKQAIKRNQLRRKLYGVLYRAHLQSKLAGVFILIAKPSAKQFSSKTLQVEAKELIGRSLI